jgi:hypothetical protein
MWNFSNGSKLKDMMSQETGRKVDKEVTGLVCVCDPRPDSNEGDLDGLKES